MPVEYKDYYKILGVAKSATADEIRKAYRKLARQHHPDVSKQAGAEARFKEVNEAHEVLSDPEKRTRYDTVGANWEQFARGAGGGGGGGFQWVYTGTPGAEDLFGGATGFSDFFRTLFGDLGGSQTNGRARTRRGSQRGFEQGRAFERDLFDAERGADTEHELEVTLADAYRGTERTIDVRLEHGATRRLSVKVPAGVRDDQRIRLAGQGGTVAGGAPRGDLYLRVKVRPHPFLTRDGDDLRAELPVALHEALLGADVTVPTLKGRVSLRIPPETQNGRTIRLAGQGMPRAGAGHGDLYVTVKVVLPQKLSESERELARGLAERRAGENVRSHLL